MDLRKLKTLIDLVSESNISELEIVEADGKVRIVKGGARNEGAAGGPVAAPVALPDPALAIAAALAAAEPTGHVVKSPMVGTFYRSASPGSEAFAQVGAVVKEGQPICIIEAKNPPSTLSARRRRA